MDIVREFDANSDGALDFSEFSQMVLPATNSSLRSVAEQRRYGPYFCAHKALPRDCVQLLVRLLEKEAALQRHRNESKRQLLVCPDFIKVRTFNDVARGLRDICVSDLIRYLENNGFYPRRDDVEAILRRVDHDADQHISYEEFCELTCVTDSKATAESPQRASAAKASPQKADSSFMSPEKQSQAAEPKSASPKKLDLNEADKTELKKPAADSQEKGGLSPEQKKARDQDRNDVQAQID